MSKLKIANYNISGGFYIGNEDSEYLDRESATKIDNKMQNEVIDFINNEKIDIICFEEIITTEEIKYLETIKEKTNLKYYDFFELSPNHLVDNTNSGLAIFSKYPLTTLKKEFFPNPMLSKTTSSGKTYYTFDKGYIICEVEVNEKKIKVLNHHGFPYRRFNSTPEDNAKIFNVFDEAIINNNVDVVVGDFNANDFMNLMPKTNELYVRTINEVSTVDGMKFDDIVVKKGTNYNKKVQKLLSDHFIVVADIEI